VLGTESHQRQKKQPYTYVIADQKLELATNSKIILLELANLYMSESPFSPSRKFKQKEERNKKWSLGD
jgi:hypothetical protein